MQLPCLALSRNRQSDLRDRDCRVENDVDGEANVDGNPEPAHGPEEFQIQQEECNLDKT